MARGFCRTHPNGVMPAKAGIQLIWIPAFAGMTSPGRLGAPCDACPPRAPATTCDRTPARRRPQGHGTPRASRSRKYRPAYNFGSIEYPAAARPASHAATPSRGTWCTTISSVSSPPPGTHALQPARAHEGDLLVAHPGRGRPGHDEIDAPRAIAGLLLQFALRGLDHALVRLPLDVADQPGRHLDRQALDRDAVLLHEQDLVGIGGGDHDHGPAGIGALGELPRAALPDPQPAAVEKGLGFRHRSRPSRRPERVR